MHELVHIHVQAHVSAIMQKRTLELLYLHLRWIIMIDERRAIRAMTDNHILAHQKTTRNPNNTEIPLHYFNIKGRR